MMLHIIFDQGWRPGAATHASEFTRASGQVLDTFQLLANSNILFTTNWPWVVKSFCPSPLKSPHRPQTFPCHQERLLWGSRPLLLSHPLKSMKCWEISVLTGTYTMLWLQEDAHRCFAIPYHCQTDGRIYHQVQADCSYFVINPRAMSQVFFLISTLR